MLTERDLASIRKRHEAFDRQQGRLAALLSASDVPALLGEIERVSEQLAMAWIVLDGIARAVKALSEKLRPGCVRLADEIGGMGEEAARLLREQGAPGGK